MVEFLPVLLILFTFAALLAGYPVALTLGGASLMFAFLGMAIGAFNPNDFGFLPGRLFGIVTNQTLIAVPLFVFMGVLLEKTEIAKELLTNLSGLFGAAPGGLALTVILVGALMAASTGIVGATVVTLGMIALPVMVDKRYDPKISTGTIAATGTLGQLIPPSISLVLLGDVLSNAYQQAQLNMGIFAPKSVSVGDLFAGAIVPGAILVGLYTVYILIVSVIYPSKMPSVQQENAIDVRATITSLIPPIALIFSVLGSIIIGLATPTEAAGVGAVGAMILAGLKRKLTKETLSDTCQQTISTTSMVFFILIGASIFSLVFRGFGGEEMVQNVFASFPGGLWGALAIVMLVIFLLGFILDFIEITFVVVPIVGPVLMAMGADPIWLGILIAVNLQTSFLTPPFGFALFYLRGVAPNSIKTQDIYKGALPFIAIQIILLAMILRWPSLSTWLPANLYG